MSASATPYSFDFTRPCRYLFSLGNPSSPAILAMHGHGMTPTVMLDLVRQMLGPEPTIASLEAPNTCFLSPDYETAEIGFNWGTRATADFHTEVHHRIVLGALDDLERRHGCPSHRVALLGFSQPVGLNYRFAASYPNAVRGIIGLCGGVPKNWEDGEPASVPAALLHIARSEDEFYSPDTSLSFEERLRWRAPYVEFHLLPGRHRVPSKAGPIIQAWLRRVFPA